MISNATYGRVSQSLGALSLFGSFLSLKLVGEFLTSDSLSNGLPQIFLINSVAFAALGINAILTGSKLVKTKLA